MWLKSTIGDAKIIDTSKMNADTVQILTKVELKNAKTGMMNTIYKCFGFLVFLDFPDFFRYFFVG